MGQRLSRRAFQGCPHDGADGADPPGIIARFRDELAPGSYLVISHGTQDGMTPETAKVGNDMFARTATPFIGRSRARVAELFEGFDLVEPGLVWSVSWRPEHPDEVIDVPERSAAYVGVGLKR